MNRRVLIGLCLLIAAADLIQPLLGPWRAKFLGAVLGGLFYLASGLAICRGWRPAALGIIALPMLPASLLGLWALGLATPITPDAAMIGIFGLQILAALAALRWRCGGYGPVAP